MSDLQRLNIVFFLGGGGARPFEHNSEVRIGPFLTPISKIRYLTKKDKEFMRQWKRGKQLFCNQLTRLHSCDTSAIARALHALESEKRQRIRIETGVSRACSPWSRLCACEVCSALSTRDSTRQHRTPGAASRFSFHAFGN